MGKTKEMYIEQQEQQIAQGNNEMLDADYLYQEWLKEQPRSEEIAQNTPNLQS